MTRAASQAALSVDDAHEGSFWLDRTRPEHLTAGLRQGLASQTSTDLLIVGAGLTGLWAAIEAADQGREVLLVDAGEVGGGASGRCGGFINPSITHGIANGHQRWPDSMPEILRIQRSLWQDTLRFLEDHNGAGTVEPVGKLVVCTRQHERNGLATMANVLTDYGEECSLLDADQAQELVNSPTYLGGLFHDSFNGLCDPVELSWVLAMSALERGVNLVENAPIEDLEDDDRFIRATSGRSEICARQVLLATNAYKPLRKRLRARVIPVYDHVIVTAPLSNSQRSETGWRDKVFGITDAGNQFHYYRPTPDGRILFGGWDATYHFGGRIDPRYEQSPATHRLLVDHLIETFPHLADVVITHKWGGPIDSTSRFTPMFDTAMGGKLGWAIGFTGLGVGASRFGAQVALDLLAGSSTERTLLPIVGKQPLPFPPEPFRWPIIQFTKRAMQREDELGRKGLWLSLLSRFGVGFDS